MIGSKNQLQIKKLQAAVVVVVVVVIYLSTFHN